MIATAHQLTVRAAHGIVTTTVASLLDIANAGSGDVTIFNVGDASVVGALSNAGGKISVTDRKSTRLNSSH